MCDRCVFSLQAVSTFSIALVFQRYSKCKMQCAPCTSHKNAHGNEMLWTWKKSNILWIRPDSLYFCRKHDIYYVKLLIFTKKFYFVKLHSMKRERERERPMNVQSTNWKRFFFLSLNDNRCNRTNGVNRKLIWPMKLFGLFFCKSLLRMEIYNKYIMAELQWSV